MFRYRAPRHLFRILSIPDQSNNSNIKILKKGGFKK